MINEGSPLFPEPPPTRRSGGWCHPNGALYRNFVLLIISLTCFGTYFAYDCLAPLEVDIRNDMDISYTEYGILYSIYSVPNIVLVFFGGLIGEQIGHRAAGLFFSSLVVLGSLIVAVGTMSSNYSWAIMVFGRFIFGIGAETLNITQTAMVAKWFSDGNLSLSFDFVVFISRLGDFLGLGLSAVFAEMWDSWKWSIWMGTFATILSFFCVVIYCIMDRVGDKYRSKYVDNDVEPNFSAIPNLEIRFWLTCLISMIYYAAVIPFVANCSDFLYTEYGYSKVSSGWMTSVIILAPMLLSPLFSKAVEITGRRPFYTILGICGILPAHLMLTVTTEFHPLIPITMVGLSFALVPGALWPCVPLLVHPSDVSTAFGLMASLQSAGLAAVNLIVGILIDKNDHFWAMGFFSILDVIALLLAIALFIVDGRKDGRLTIIPSRSF